MDILEWINVGKVSAERDDNLSNYFYDNGVLKNVISSKSSFLVLGRKGAGKTAVFKYLSENKNEFLHSEDILISLSFEDYNWNIHALLEDRTKAISLAYKHSWKFVILIESIRAYIEWFEFSGKRIPKDLKKTQKILEKIFTSPIPTLSEIVSNKIFKLSSFKLPKGGIDLENGSFDSIELGGGEITFDEVNKDCTLQQHLSENIDNLITYLEQTISDIPEILPKIFICFDRVDEAWDEVSFESSKRVIAGLVSASDAITSNYNGLIRPIIFLREDIFEVLSLNDSNKLREDCGALLHWKKDTLSTLMLSRINFYAKQNNQPFIESIDELFDRKEMRQRAKPYNYLLKRTMMRPRDIISLMRKIIASMQEKQDDPFAEESATFSKLEVESIYAAEPGYSDWLKQEILDEWNVQYPIIMNLFDALQNNGNANFTKEEFLQEMLNLNSELSSGELNEHLKFLFDNSIIGFKLGAQSQWRFKCFYPTQGFLDSTEYRVHEGLVRALNLRENRERD